MKFRPAKRHIIRGVLWLGLLAYVAYGVVEPQSSPGHVMFHLGYSLPASRPAFLRFYQWSLRAFNGGYLPSAIDEFFMTRLWNGPSPDDGGEWQALIDFQIAQGSGRWGDKLSHVHDELKKQVITDIFLRLNTFSPQKAVSSLELVESLRRDDALRKGGFSGLDFGTGRRKHSASSLERLATAKTSFRQWWASGSAWPANKSQNPLGGTDLVIHEGP